MWGKFCTAVLDYNNDGNLLKKKQNFVILLFLVLSLQILIDILLEF
jgi:predicted nucleic acid-binding Zn ribbon protein